MSESCALAVEASSERLSLAACRGGRVESFSAMPARTATAAIYEHAAGLLARLGAGFADLDYVAFGCGPGSFTGLRLAAAAAQSLAYAGGIPVCRVSSFAVLAAGAGPGVHAICQDARMGSAHVGLYQVEAEGSMPVALMADALVDPALYLFPGSQPLGALGGGWQAFAPMRERHAARLLGLRTDCLPSARDLLRMADQDFRAGRTVAPADALPEYLGQSPVPRPAS